MNWRFLNNFNNWLGEFAGSRVVQGIAQKRIAGYMDQVKLLLEEKQHYNKHATVEDALKDYAQRTGLSDTDVELIRGQLNAEAQVQLVNPIQKAQEERDAKEFEALKPGIKPKKKTLLRKKLDDIHLDPDTSLKPATSSLEVRAQPQPEFIPKLDDDEVKKQEEELKKKQEELKKKEKPKGEVLDIDEFITKEVSAQEDERSISAIEQKISDEMLQRGVVVDESEVGDDESIDEALGLAGLTSKTVVVPSKEKKPGRKYVSKTLEDRKKEIETLEDRIDAISNEISTEKLGLHWTTESETPQQEAVVYLTDLLERKKEALSQAEAGTRPTALIDNDDDFENALKQELGEDTSSEKVADTFKKVYQVMSERGEIQRAPGQIVVDGIDKVKCQICGTVHDKEIPADYPRNFDPNKQEPNPKIPATMCNLRKHEEGGSLVLEPRLNELERAQIDQQVKKMMKELPPQERNKVEIRKKLVQDVKQDYVRKKYKTQLEQFRGRVRSGPNYYAALREAYAQQYGVAVSREFEMAQNIQTIFNRDDLAIWTAADETANWTDARLLKIILDNIHYFDAQAAGKTSEDWAQEILNQIKTDMNVPLDQPIGRLTERGLASQELRNALKEQAELIKSYRGTETKKRHFRDWKKGRTQQRKGLPRDEKAIEEIQDRIKATEDAIADYVAQVPSAEARKHMTSEEIKAAEKAAGKVRENLSPDIREFAEKRLKDLDRYHNELVNEFYPSRRGRLLNPRLECPHCGATDRYMLTIHEREDISRPEELRMNYTVKAPRCKSCDMKFTAESLEAKLGSLGSERASEHTQKLIERQHARETQESTLLSVGDSVIHDQFGTGRVVFQTGDHVFVDWGKPLAADSSLLTPQSLSKTVRIKDKEHTQYNVVFPNLEDEVVQLIGWPASMTIAERVEDARNELQEFMGELPPELMKSIDRFEQLKGQFGATKDIDEKKAMVAELNALIADELVKKYYDMNENLKVLSKRKDADLMDPKQWYMIESFACVTEQRPRGKSKSGERAFFFTNFFKVIAQDQSGKRVTFHLQGTKECDLPEDVLRVAWRCRRDSKQVTKVVEEKSTKEPEARASLIRRRIRRRAFLRSLHA